MEDAHEISMLIFIAQHDSIVVFGDRDRKNSHSIVVHPNTIVTFALC